MSLPFSASEKAAEAARAPQLNAAAWPQLLQQATEEVFGMMLDCRIESDDGSSCSREQSGMASDTLHPPLIEVLLQHENGTGGVESEVTAVIGLAGEMCGVLNFSCAKPAARMMAAKMLGVDENDAGDEHLDAIGEICNMIAGNFKAKLPGVGERCMLSVPMLVVGSNYRLRAITGQRRVEYSFRADGAIARVLLEVQ